MYISRSNGMLNKDILVQRDTLINSNTLVGLTKDLYTEEELEELRKAVWIRNAAIVANTMNGIMINVLNGILQ